MSLFDTRAYVKNLMAAGFTQEQADAMANGQLQLLAVVATKEDLARLELRIILANLAISGVLLGALSLVIQFSGR
jgi:hypothetical protein